MSKKPRRKNREPKQPALNEPGISANWLLGLVALSLLMIGAWKFWPGSTDNDATEVSAVSADKKKNESPPKTDDTKPVAAVQADDTTIPAPGLAQRTYVAPLADAYRRIDAAADGWQTEAFNEASGKQMKLLSRLFEEPLDKLTVDSLVDDSFVCSTLCPDSLREVFRDRSLRVQRADTFEDRENGNDEFRGPAGLISAIQQFRHQYSDNAPERVKLKPFRVSTDGERATTTLYFNSVGVSELGTLQVNAKWQLDWSAGDSKKPKLLTIKLEDYESVLHRGPGERMFSDCTKSVLGSTTAYRQQFLRSTDHWRARLPRDLGLDVVANHGLAIGDVNGDQLEDLYVCQQGGLPNRLFIQNADGTLRDESATCGADWLDYCASALLVDFDNDGDRDLVVAQEWRILLMSNDGQGRFQLEFGTSSEAQSFSLSAADYDLDGDVDVYVCGYNPPASNVRRGVMGEPMPYHDANNGGQNMLLRNDGNWLFTDATVEVGLNQNNTRFSFAAAWEDYDNDGDPDLYVANDYGRNSLYQNNQGRFVDVAADRGVEDMSAGMSVSWADVNRDGRMDLYVSNMFSAAGNRITYQRQFKTDTDSNVREQFQRHARGNSLFVNNHDGFRDVSETAAVTMGRWAWGSRFADLNGDGWEDLIVANGFISATDTGDL